MRKHFQDAQDAWSSIIAACTALSGGAPLSTYRLAPHLLCQVTVLRLRASARLDSSHTPWHASGTPALPSARKGYVGLKRVAPSNTRYDTRRAELIINCLGGIYGEPQFATETGDLPRSR